MCKLLWWEVRVLGLALVDSTMLSNVLIQLSADGLGCAPSLLILAWGHPTLGSMVSMVELVENSKRTYTKGPLSGLLLPVPLSLQ